MSAVSVTDIGKCYKIYATPQARLKELFLGGQRHTPFWALDDVSFQIQPGESVGLIGLNGAGKSTLLKLITQALAPTTGVVETAGRVTAILELGTGFHHDFSGRGSGLFFG